MEQAAQAVGGDGFDVIIENASDINLGSDLTVIGPGARVVVRSTYFSNKVFVFPFFLSVPFSYLLHRFSHDRSWATVATLKSVLVS